MYTVRKLILVFLFISNNAFDSFSQLKFDFENESISDWQPSVTGHWEASSLNSINGKFSLHHSFDNSSASHDQISVLFPGNINFKNNASWSFKVRHNYNPSSSNNWAIFLFANKPSTEMCPGTAISGFVIGVNYTGSDDILKLWKVENGNVSTVIETSLNWESTIGDTAALIKVDRSATGNWVVSIAKECKSENMISLGSCSDMTVTEAKYFGIFYEYSSSQDMKLYVDDIEIVADFIKDNEGPIVDSISVLNNYIEILFNEAIDTASAIKSNFIASPGDLVPEVISFTSDRSILLKYNKLVTRTKYSMNISGIKDISNNPIIPVIKEFSYYLPSGYDVLITEIMADPDPPVSLPNYEYIELYNNTDFQINLDKWVLQSGTNSNIFPSTIINPYEYVIVTIKKAENSFRSISKTVGLWTDAYFLNNTYGLLLLKEPFGKLISYANYNNKFYNDEFKAEGGWSIEMKDLKYPCGDENNWGYSENSFGGTPGKLNSISDNYNSFKVPEHLYTLVPDDTTIILHWSNMPDFSFVQNRENYEIKSTNLNKTYPVSAELALTNFPSTKLKVSPELITEKISDILPQNKNL